MISKAALIKHLDQFPDEISIDELIDKLVFIEKLEKRVAQSKANDTISNEEMKEEMNKWQK